jgi:hypothetical protein
MGKVDFKYSISNSMLSKVIIGKALLQENDVTGNFPVSHHPHGSVLTTSPCHCKYDCDSREEKSPADLIGEM